MRVFHVYDLGGRLRGKIQADTKAQAEAKALDWITETVVLKEQQPLRERLDQLKSSPR